MEGSGADEVGIDKNSNKVVVRIDPSLLPPYQVDQLLGDAQGTGNPGMKPTVIFEQLVEIKG